MNTDQRHKITRALETIENLYPSLPVLSKLASMLKDMNIDQGDITNLIKTDASLTSDIIRISNTPYYGVSSKCSDISNALLIIGQDKVLKVVSLCISRNVFNQDLSHYGIPANDYWCNSIAAGLLMESMALPLGMDRDQAYTAGILHSVGMTIIDRVMKELNIEVYWDASIPQIEWEEYITGHNYAQAGADILKRWKFPAEFTEIIRNQIHPERMSQPNQIANSLQFVTRLLNLIGWKMQMVDTFESCPKCLEFLKANNMDQETMMGIIAQTQHQMTSIMSMFSDR